MHTTPFIIEKTYNAPVKTVWEALTDKSKMKQWYFDLNEFKPEVGFEFTFEGKGSQCEKYIHLCKVIDVIENKKLAYSWKYEGYPGYSVVTFELFEEGKDKTRLKLTHDGLETFPAFKDFGRESFASGWTELIGKSLANFVATE